MTDRVPGAPGQYKAVVTADELEKMQAGEQFTITMTRDDQPIAEGTPYSKAAVLPDSLASAICPGVPDPTPADAFSALYTDKAPSGYGLGGSVYFPADNVDEILAPGWYRTSGITINGNTFNYVYMRVDAYNNTGCTQTLHVIGAVATTLQRIRYNSEWGEWEWVNPPMVLGVEYRTTKRYKGKVVYIKAVDIGNLPASAEKSVTYYSNGSTNVVNLTAVAISSTNRTNLFPFISTSGTIVARVYASQFSVVINTYSDLSTYTAVATVEYTKD